MAVRMAKIKILEITLSNGITMPVLGLGTWQLRGEECRDVVKTAIEIGYTHIDTAEMYGNEKEIGEAIQGFDREKLFITSKVSPWHLSYDNILKRCEKSLAELRTDYIDLYLIHWPRPMNTETVLSAFKLLYDEGKILAFGVSNFAIRHLKHILPVAKRLGLPITINQIELHPYLKQDALLDFCRENDISITAYSPLATGLAITDEILIDLASQYGRTPAQMTLRWLVEKGVTVIPKASSREHLEEDLRIFDFRLRKADADKIDLITKKGSYSL